MRQISLPMTDRCTAVEIAFQLRDGERREPASVRAMNGSPLVAYFPTEKEPRLGILIATLAVIEHIEGVRAGRCDKDALRRRIVCAMIECTSLAVGIGMNRPDVSMTSSFV